MDLRAYYRKIRQIEEGLEESDVVVVSNETPDGGKAGVLSEASRGIAARLLVEGRARLATAEESAAYRKEMVEANKRAQETAAASRVQVAVISENELRAYKSAKSQK
ncbi:MAG: hypothetical protein KIT09_27680 [Bryobacteraceae bacterium]|nr:hypothetical protein [Bryobacteraceae bacterium]